MLSPSCNSWSLKMRASHLTMIKVQSMNPNCRITELVQSTKMSSARITHQLSKPGLKKSSSYWPCSRTYRARATPARICRGLSCSSRSWSWVTCSSKLHRTKWTHRSRRSSRLWSWVRGQNPSHRPLTSKWSPSYWASWKCWGSRMKWRSKWRHPSRWSTRIFRNLRSPHQLPRRSTVRFTTAHTLTGSNMPRTCAISVTICVGRPKCHTAVSTQTSPITLTECVKAVILLSITSSVRKRLRLN